MAIVSPSDLVFITGKGVEMKDEAQVSVYNLAADNVPIHVFPFPLFVRLVIVVHFPPLVSRLIA